MSEKKPNYLVAYSDVKWGLLVYPLMALAFIFFASDNSLEDLIRIPSFGSDLILALGLTGLVGIYLGFLVRKLDQRMPWEQNKSKRIRFHMLFGIFIPLIVSMTVEMIYLKWIKVDITNSSMFNLELPLALLFLVLINLLYILNYLLFENKKIQSNEQPNLEATFVVVEQGSLEKPIEYKQIACIQSKDKLLWLYTLDGAKYRISENLQFWEKRLPSSDFFRLNRQFIAARKAIQSIYKTETRKLGIQMISEMEQVYVSKSNATRFRAWWTGNSPL